jgi:hypothetical protein
MIFKKGRIKNHQGYCFYISITVFLHSFGISFGRLKGRPLRYWKREIISNITNKPSLYIHFNIFKTRHLFLGISAGVPLKLLKK